MNVFTIGMFYFSLLLPMGAIMMPLNSLLVSIASAKPPIPKVRHAPTIPIVAPTTHVEATISIQAQASTTWSWQMIPPWVQATWGTHHATWMLARQQVMSSPSTPIQPSAE
jgi:hypothetical protein